MWGCKSRFCPQVWRMADEPDLRAEALRIGRDFEHGRGTGSK